MKDLAASEQTGLLVAFPPIEARPLRTIIGHSHTGDVLLFTGVRYERLTTKPPRLKGQRNGKASRRAARKSAE